VILAPTWAVAVHGGAKNIAEDEEEANRSGCLQALAAGRAVLERGGQAVDAVEAAVRVLEDDPTFNAGYGSVRNDTGEVEMDAALMDGSTLDLGAVGAIKGVRHPITVARLMLREPPVLLVAEGAYRFAVEHGAKSCDPAALIRALAPGGQNGSRAAAGHDTVGCVALDTSGNVAAGTSTGGIEGCPPGRVGDSPLPGCGFYADNDVGAVVFSGDGEQIARATLAAEVVRTLNTAPPKAAIDRALHRLARVGGEAGGIVLDPQGRFAQAHNSSHFAVAWMTKGMREPRVSVRASEAV
jgi:beta-aspartyl-peptidase (threonine type)